MYRSLDAHVTQEALCYRVLGIKTKGKDCVKCPNLVFLTRQELIWGAKFKRQDCHVRLKAVSSRAKMAVDGPDGLPLLLCCRCMVAKAI